MANCSMPSIGQILWGNRISPALDVLSLGMEKKEKKKKKFLVPERYRNMTASAAAEPHDLFAGAA